MNRRFGGIYLILLRGRKSAEQETSILSDASSVKMEKIHSSESSVHLRTTRRYIPQNGDIHITAVRTLNPA
jgi:hypothetical protein